VKNRLQRILVPLVVGWVLLYPVLVLIWLWGASTSGRLAEFGVPPEAQNWPVWALTLGFFMTAGFVQKFDLTHLWFLHQLLVLYALMLAIRWLAARWDKIGCRMERVDTWFARVVRGPGTLYGFVLPSIPLLLLMDAWGVDTPKESLLPHVPTTLLFGFCFFTGWLWQRQPALLETFGRRWVWYMSIGWLAWAGLLASHGKIPWVRPAYTFVYAHMMWGLVLGFLGLFTRFCQKGNEWTRYVADASYWIYIVHLPVVVALQVLVARLPLPWPIKYTGICLVTLAGVFFSYHYFVRATFIGVQLNGRKYPRAWPSRLKPDL
jgi:glucans biosynthesis protein C